MACPQLRKRRGGGDPVPWEATVSYGQGTADGPEAVLQASHQVDLLDRETGRPYEAASRSFRSPKRCGGGATTRGRPPRP